MCLLSRSDNIMFFKLPKCLSKIKACRPSVVKKEGKRPDIWCNAKKNMATAHLLYCWENTYSFHQDSWQFNSQSVLQNQFKTISFKEDKKAKTWKCREIGQNAASLAIGENLQRKSVNSPQQQQYDHGTITWWPKW